jgi:hypothetical protein
LRPSSIGRVYNVRLVFATWYAFEVMAEKENSAFRLRRFVQKMVGQPDNMTTVQALLNAFGESKGKGARHEAAIVSRLTSLLFTELDLLTEESSRAGFDDEARQQIFNAFDRLSVQGLVGAWQANKPHFSNSLQSLLIFGQGLPDEGIVISEDNLNTLRNALDSFREEIEKSDLSSVVKGFVYQQLNFIARAIKDYPVAGVKAFRTAVREAIIHDAEHAEVVEELKKTKEMTLLKDIWRTVLEISKYTVDFKKLLEAGDFIYSHGEKIAHATKGVIEHLK